MLKNEIYKLESKLLNEKPFYLSNECSRENKKHKKLINVLNNVSISIKYGKEIIDEILREYEIISERINLRGINTYTLTAVLTYVVLRKKGIPITLKDMEEIFGIEKKYVGRIYRRIYYKFKDIPPQSVENFIERGIKELNLSERVKERALEIYKSNMNILKTFRPNSIAAYCIYEAARMKGEPRSQKEVAKVLNVSVLTINKIKRFLKNRKKLREKEERRIFYLFKKFNLLLKNI